jgi:hypothetical protein
MSQRITSAAAAEWAGGPIDPSGGDVPTLDSAFITREQSSTDSVQAVPFLFRVFFLYFVIQALPIDGQFVRNLVATDSGYTRYVFNLSRYAPRFFGPDDTFANWGVVLILALLGAAGWTVFDRKKGTVQWYNEGLLSYWLRVILRYRLALGVLAYGFIKLFPLQAPTPSLSNLNTAYGDHSAWKLFSLSLGIVPSYESFLGAVEVLGGLLLLHRKTATIGTLVLLPFLGNIFVSNLAYEGQEYVYSGLLVTFGLVLFGYDAVRLFRLVSLELPALPNRVKPRLTHRWQRLGRLTFKVTFIALAVLVYGISTYGSYRNGGLRFPKTPGLPGVAGLYTVSEFRQGNTTIPYSNTHPFRWQDVVFETWNTVSIKSNRPVRLHHSPTETLPTQDSDRDYELAGSQGRHYYHYTVNSAGTVLTLTNANPNHKAETLQFNLSKGPAGQLILSGIAEKQDSVYAVLDKVNKKYLIDEAAKAGRRGSLTL